MNVLLQTLYRRRGFAIGDFNIEVRVDAHKLAFLVFKMSGQVSNAIFEKGENKTLWDRFLNQTKCYDDDWFEVVGGVIEAMEQVNQQTRARNPKLEGGSFGTERVAEELTPTLQQAVNDFPCDRQDLATQTSFQRIRQRVARIVESLIDTDQVRNARAALNIEQEPWERFVAILIDTVASSAVDQEGQADLDAAIRAEVIRLLEEELGNIFREEA